VSCEAKARIGHEKNVDKSGLPDNEGPKAPVNKAFLRTAHAGGTIARPFHPDSDSLIKAVEKPRTEVA